MEFELEWLCVKKKLHMKTVFDSVLWCYSAALVVVYACMRALYSLRTVSRSRLLALFLCLGVCVYV